MAHLTPHLTVTPTQTVVDEVSRYPYRVRLGVALPVALLVLAGVVGSVSFTITRILAGAPMPNWAYTALVVFSMVLLRGVGVQVTRGAHALRMTLLAPLVVYLYIGGAYTSAYPIWAVTTFVVLQFAGYDRRSGLLQALTTAFIGLVFSLTTGVVTLAGLPSPVAVLVGTVVSVCSLPLVFRRMLTMEGVEPVRMHWRRLVQIMVGETLACWAAIGADHLGDAIDGGGRFQDLLDVRAVVLLVVTIIVVTWYERYRRRMLRRQLDAMVRAALALPWDDSDTPVLVRLEEFARRAIPAGTVTLRDRPPRVAEIGEQVHAPDGGGSWLVVTSRDNMTPFSRTEQHIVEGLAHMASVTLASRRRIDDLAQRANTDDLTGVLNYRGFRLTAQRVIDETGIVPPVLYLDLDDFKVVNDVHGHHAGNLVLEEVARRLRGALRPNDVIGRIGGDEFVVMLPGATDEDAARAVARRVQQGINRPMHIDGQVITLTVSVGVAGAVPGRTSVTDLLEEADERMYEGKKRRLDMGIEQLLMRAAHPVAGMGTAPGDEASTAHGRVMAGQTAPEEPEETRDADSWEASGDRSTAQGTAARGATTGGSPAGTPARPSDWSNATSARGVITPSDLETQVRHGIEAGRLSVWFQPTVRLADAKVIGVEALVRYRDDHIGDVPPQLIVDVANRTGLLSRLTEQVVRGAFAGIERIRRADPEVASLNVNFEAGQVLDQTLMGVLAEHVEAHPDVSFVFELSERSLDQATDDVLERLVAFTRDHGMMLALDDFGKAFSSVNSLVRFPANLLKLDKSLTDYLATQPERAGQLITGLTHLARTMSFTISAEGIETPGQRGRLQRVGVRYGQGFLFSRPKSVDRLIDWLGAHRQE